MSDYVTFRDPTETTGAMVYRAICSAKGGITVAELLAFIGQRSTSRVVSAMCHAMVLRGRVTKEMRPKPGTARLVAYFMPCTTDRRFRAVRPVASVLRAAVQRLQPCTIEAVAHATGLSKRTVRDGLRRMLEGEEVRRVGPANAWRYELAPLEDDLPLLPYVNPIRARALGLRKAA